MKNSTKGAAATVLAATMALAPASAAIAGAAPQADQALGGANKQAGQLKGDPGKVDILSGPLTVAQDILAVAQEQADIDNNREGVVRGLREAGWYESGEDNNILVIKEDHDYDADLQGVESDAVYQYPNYPKFRVVAFDSGTVTNNGDGGYINWAFRGSFERDDMTVTFD